MSGRVTDKNIAAGKKRQQSPKKNKPSRRSRKCIEDCGDCSFGTKDIKIKNLDIDTDYTTERHLMNIEEQAYHSFNALISDLKKYNIDRYNTPSIKKYLNFYLIEEIMNTPFLSKDELYMDQLEDSLSEELSFDGEGDIIMTPTLMKLLSNSEDF